MLSFNGGKIYRIVSVHEDITIREIKEHGGSDYDEYAIVTVGRVGDAEHVDDLIVSKNHVDGTCTILKYVGRDAVVAPHIK